MPKSTILAQSIGQIDKTTRTKAYIKEQESFEKAIKAARDKRLELKIPQHQISHIAHVHQSQISSLERLRFALLPRELVTKYLAAMRIAIEKLKAKNGALAK